MAHPQGQTQHLDSSDITLLSVLGTVRDDRVPLTDIISAAKEIAPEEWQPTVELVENCVVSAMNKSLLRLSCPFEPEPPFELEITESGRSALRCLLRRSVPCLAGGFARTCVAAKLCFLEFLDPDEQLTQMEQLACNYRKHVSALRNQLASRSTDKSARSRRLADEIERFEWERTRLDRLRTNLRHARRPAGAQAVSARASKEDPCS